MRRVLPCRPVFLRRVTVVMAGLFRFFNLALGLHVQSHVAAKYEDPLHRKTHYEQQSFGEHLGKEDSKSESLNRGDQKNRDRAKQDDEEREFKRFAQDLLFLGFENDVFIYGKTERAACDSSHDGAEDNSSAQMESDKKNDRIENKGQNR